MARHRQHFDALQAQIAEQVVVTGIVHQRRVAWFEQIADYQLEGLAGAIRQQNLAGMCGDAEPGQHQREMLAQR